MISALSWVERGAAKERPLKYELDDNEFSRIREIASKNKNNINEVEEREQVPDVDMAEAVTQETIDPELAEYDLDNYEDDNDKELGIFGKIKELAYYEVGEKDPYIDMEGNDDQDSELEDVLISSKDNLILAARTEDEISQLEVYVYERDKNHLYVHHDILLPTFPLCLEWLDFRSAEEKGNYVAVGTFEPQIEIWDLDVIDAGYPKTILGDGKQKKKKIARADRHVAAVMSLCWNHQHRHLLASSSADHTVKLWDLTQEKAVYSFDHHQDKVQSVIWHPVESTVMLTASFDKTIALFDSRAPTSSAKLPIIADPEIARWYPQHPERCLISLENGLVLCYDMRMFNDQGSLFTLHAHDKAVTAMDISTSISGCLVTGSIDQTIKVWDIENNRPAHILTRSMDVGKIFTASFCPDAALLMAIAGSEGKLQLWDLATKAGVRKIFQDRGNFDQSSTEAEKEPITVDDDVTDSDSDEAYDPPDLEGDDQSESEEEA